jgi:hypothetical protein
MQVLPQNKIVAHQIGAMKFGNIPAKQLHKVLADGRILGQIMETEAAHSYHGFSKVGVNPKSETEDLFYAGGSKVQCKTLNFRWGKIVSITKSTLWDTNNGGRRSWKEWDAMHNQFFDEQDYFMLFDITNFENRVVDILFMSRDEFKRKTAQFLAEQIQAEHDRRRKKFNSTTSIQKRDNESNVLPKWEYPAKMTIEMWNSFRG